MDIRVRSRDSSDVRDEFGIHDGFNSFSNDEENEDRRLSLESSISGRQSTLVGTDLGQSIHPTTSGNGSAAEKTQKDPNEVGFDGPDDPEDPLNMPTWRKWVIVVVIASASTCVTCASSMAASTYAGLQKSFHISEEVAILTVSLFVLGLGVGPLFLGPVSEFVGRRIVYLWSFLAFLLFTIPVALSNNAPVHLIFRFVTGFTGSAFLAVAGGTVADLFETRKLGTPMTVYSTTPFLGPVLGPLVAGFINYNVNWRWTYYVLMIWAGIDLVLVYLLVPETYQPELLRRKAVRLRRSTGNHALYAPIEHNRRSFWHQLGVSLKTPLFVIARQLMAVLLTIWVALVLGILYLFFNAFPITFMGKHGFNQEQAGLSFLGIGVGQLLAAFSTPIWSRIYKRAAARHGGHAPPEARLIMGMAGAVAVPVGIWIFAFTTYRHVHWIWPIIGSIPFGAGTVWTFNSVFSYLVDAYRPVSASALSFNSFVRCATASGFPLFARQMYDRLGTVGASALLAGLVTCMTPLPFVFYRMGARLREQSDLSLRGQGPKVKKEPV